MPRAGRLAVELGDRPPPATTTPKGGAVPIRPENRGLYPKDWPTISHTIRYARAQGRCECDGRCGTGHHTRCTAINHGPHPVTGSRVVLTVAHLDHNPANCDDSNLMAACQRCHLAYDAPHHAETRARTRRAAAEAAGQLTLETP